MTSKTVLDTRFIPVFSPFALLGLLYTILAMFTFPGPPYIAQPRASISCFRAHGPILHHNVVFCLLAILLPDEGVWKCGQQRGYEMAAVQAFTARSNDFVNGGAVSRRGESWLTIEFALKFFLGTRCCRCNCRLWCQLGPSARSDYWASCGGPSSTFSYMGGIIIRAGCSGRGQKTNRPNKA